MNITKYISCLFVFGLVVPNAFAGAWTQDKGKGLIITGTSYNQADRAFDSESKLRTPVEFEKLDSTLYIEYGLTDILTLVGNTTLQDVSFTSSEGPQFFSCLLYTSPSPRD